MASFTNYLTQGSRIFLSSWKNKLSPKKYEGNAYIICKKIVKKCWNGKFFQTSTTNFPQFWTRDFGWCVKSLIELGYKEEVHKTIKYALHRFKKEKKIATSLTPSGKPFDFPLPAVDSLPYFIHSMFISKFPYYDHKDFLNKEITKFYHSFIDKDTGLVKKQLHVSSIKDFSVRKSSCYDNSMVALLAKDLKNMKLINPFSKFDYPQLIKKHFWSGTYFFDDLSRKDYISGDANLFPFIFGICKDKEMIESSIKSIQFADLDYPFPLKYTQSRKDITFIPQEIFMRDYESDSIWTHMGPLFIKLVQQIDMKKANDYKKEYTKIIEKHKNYLEVFTVYGKPFSTPFYYCDRGMLWAANYLTL